jgi:hypothetical protein
MLTISFASTSAPFASSTPTTSELPLEEAAMSAVSPFCGAGEHSGQRLPPPSFRGPPACPHQHTPRVALKACPSFTHLDYNQHLAVAATHLPLLWYMILKFLSIHPSIHPSVYL